MLNLMSIYTMSNMGGDNHQMGYMGNYKKKSSDVVQILPHTVSTFVHIIYYELRIRLSQKCEIQA